MQLRPLPMPAVLARSLAPSAHGAPSVCGGYGFPESRCCIYANLECVLIRLTRIALVFDKKWPLGRGFEEPSQGLDVRHAARSFVVTSNCVFALLLFLFDFNRLGKRNEI